MNIKKFFIGTTALSLFSFGLLLTGCGEAPQQESTPEVSSEPRDNTPKVLLASADGEEVLEDDLISVDISHTDQGYLMVSYHGTNQKPKVQIMTPDEETTYTYLIQETDTYITYPLTFGDGIYTISLFENVEGDVYANVFSEEVDVALADDFLPFLYANEYCSFSEDSDVVDKGMELAEGATSDLDVVSNVYHYVVNNITYDTEKANTVTYGYLPDVDDTLASGTGICFDYAALMTSMLRSQQIPTRLEIGYAGDVYHAWISTYVDGIGWIDNIIEFDGTDWAMMDPTFAANSDNDNPVGNGTNYLLMYSY